MDTDLLIHRLQMLQNRLYDMANDLGNLTDPEIVAVSEEADRLIVQLQKRRMDKHELKKQNGVSPKEPLFANSQSPEEVREKSRALLLKHS